MAINNNSAIFADGYALCTQIKRSGLNIQSSLEVGWKMIAGGYLGVFQAVNLANMTWVDNTCTITIAWPKSGWSINTAGLGDICVALYLSSKHARLIS